MYTETNRIAVAKWRKNNREQYNEYMRENIYQKHCEKIKGKRMGKYYLEKELKIFRQILL